MSASTTVNIEGPYGIGSDCWPGTSKLIEECGELQQVLGKLIALGGATAHWDGSDLRERLIEEIGDVSAALNFFVTTNNLPMDRVVHRRATKSALFAYWHGEQQTAQKPEGGVS
jgi:NTP pyrophosphatase (non-canonical NTP hydrolase)